MLKMSREKLQSALSEIDQASYNHDRWYKDLIRTISCNLSPDQRDLEEDAYRQCRFGQWYYTLYDYELAQHQTFQAIEHDHRKMHELAMKLLSASMQHEPIPVIDYDNFANVLDRLRINMKTLKHEIEETLYNRDPLTGARNRISMLSDLRKLRELVQRGVQCTSVCLMDLDHFKEVNDTYGHQAGDQVLVNVTEYILSHMRPYDKIYRYGGEEFLISMPSTDAETAMAIIDRIRDGLAMMNAAYIGEEQVLRITASFGVASLEAEITVEDAIDRADRALYRAKGEGRNRAVAWSADL